MLGKDSTSTSRYYQHSLRHLRKSELAKAEDIVVKQVHGDGVMYNPTLLLGDYSNEKSRINSVNKPRFISF